MSKSVLAPKVIPRTYAALRHGVEETLLTGQRRIEEARVRTYWETGRLIHAHLLRYEGRADYGAQVMGQLGEDLGVSERLLYQCLQFVRAFPILHARAELGWAHYRLLVRVEDKTQRGQMEAEAARNRWTSRELEDRIRPVHLLNAASPAETSGTRGSRPSGNARPLAPKRGRVGICQIVGPAESLSVDLGFTSYLDLTGEQAGGLKAGAFVRLDAKGEFLPAEDAKTSDLYTYRAEILRVVDGDTLWMKIYLRPRHWLKEKLRLRGLDCPEMDTAAGKAAKRFVETLVAQATAVTITTTKPDKYDRYLSDIFLETNSGPEIVLNNALLENGHAIRKDGYTLSDWEELSV